jgi:hypothetical protein
VNHRVTSPRNGLTEKQIIEANALDGAFTVAAGRR